MIIIWYRSHTMYLAMPSCQPYLNINDYVRRCYLKRSYLMHSRSPFFGAERADCCTEHAVQTVLISWHDISVWLTIRNNTRSGVMPTVFGAIGRFSATLKQNNWVPQMTQACRATPSWQLKWCCFLTCPCVSAAITNCKVYLSCQVELPNRCCFRVQSHGTSLLPSTCGWIPQSATADFLSAPLAERPSPVPELNLYLPFF